MHKREKVREEDLSTCVSTFDTKMLSTSNGCYEHSQTQSTKQMVFVIIQANSAIKQ